MEAGFFTVNLSVHPDKSWTAVKALHYGEGKGNCVTLELRDNVLGSAHFAFHYGEEVNYEAFRLLLKEAIDGLPDEQEVKSAS